jgi:hypothetical protein
VLAALNKVFGEWNQVFPNAACVVIRGKSLGCSMVFSAACVVLRCGIFLARRAEFLRESGGFEVMTALLFR